MLRYGPDEKLCGGIMPPMKRSETTILKIALALTPANADAQTSANADAQTSIRPQSFAAKPYKSWSSGR
jgi:hypothetical protein